jgi:transcriptional regulator GlxA family with amidase domain
MGFQIILGFRVGREVEEKLKEAYRIAKRVGSAVEARSLLISSHLNISQVAYEAGFNDSAFFRGLFRRNTARRPANFAKKSVVEPDSSPLYRKKPA